MEIVNQSQKKPRVLCLHGSRSNVEIFKNDFAVKWPETVLDKLDLVFLNGPFLHQDKVDSEGIFHPPFYEWFQANKDFTEFYNFEECVQYVEANMEKYGPFDGVLGFSQGAILTAAMPGMQRDKVALTKVPKIKFVIIMSGAKFGGSLFTGCPKLAATAFSSPIECPSLHFMGKKESQKAKEELVECFVNPVVIHHPEGHMVPRLDNGSMKIVTAFINKVQKIKMPLQGNSKL